MHVFIFHPLTLDEIYISLIGNPSAQTSRKCTVYNCDPGATRTHGQWLKRPLLYQLSYGIKILKIRGGKLHEIIPRCIEKDLELHS